MRPSAARSIRRSPRPWRLLPVCLLAVLVCGCGSPARTGDTPASATGGGSATAKPSPHHHTPGMVMGGGPRSGTAGAASATATGAAAVDARRVPGRTLRSGTFTAAGTGPRVTGSGWLADGPGGTTVTVEVAGLPTGAWYMVHLGTQPCSAGDDATYTFPAAGGRPAHSLHVMFSPTGAATTVTQEDPADAAGMVRSLVLLPESMQGRIACADLA